MKKMTLLLLMAFSFLATAHAQNSLPVSCSVQSDKVILDYDLDSDFFGLYDVSRYIVVTRLSDSDMDILWLGKIFPDRNNYPDSTFGATTSFQTVAMSDSAILLLPNTQYRIDLEVSGLDSATMNT